MLSFRRIKNISNFGPVYRFAAVAGLFLGCVLGAHAQRPNDRDVKPGMERLSEETAALRLDAFRVQRLSGDYVFEFQLEHKPRRARTIRFDGIMWGSWNEMGAITRVKIFDPRERSSDGAAVEFIIQNGPDSTAWRRKSEESSFLKLDDSEILEPILEGLAYSVFDLQMPFIYWSDFTYEGPKLFSGSRIAQEFRMYPENGDSAGFAGVESVRISLDDTYDALLQVEVFGRDEEPKSRFKVESFKKIDGQYIVNRISLLDFESRDRTTFHVKDASVGVALEAGVFDPRKPSL